MPQASTGQGRVGAAPRSELRRDSSRASGIGDLRLRARGLHRRPRGEGRALRVGGRGHAVSGRDRRHAARAAGQAGHYLERAVPLHEADEIRAGGLGLSGTATGAGAVEVEASGVRPRRCALVSRSMGWKTLGLPGRPGPMRLRRRPARKRDTEGRAIPGATADGDRATAGFGELLGDGQAQARPLRLGRAEEVEDLLDLPAPVVSVMIPPSADMASTALPTRFTKICSRIIGSPLITGSAGASRCSSRT